jgi:putative transposase
MLVTSSRFCFDIEHETTDLDRESHPRWTCATPSASRPIPTAAWTLQQLREAIPFDHEYRFIIHDHDAIFSAELDASLTRLGLKVITTPVRSPQANSLCERLIGTLRRECLDWIIPLSEGHLSKVLASWMAHYNRGRPHSALGPGIPDPRLADLRVKPCGHRLPVGHRVVATPILGGLHREYSLQRPAA